MLGPEAVPYGSIGAYANALSVNCHLSDWQTRQFLIDDIPREDLSTIGAQVYKQTAALADKPGSAGYHGALESIVWGDKVDTSYRRYSTFTGVIGAGIGSSMAVAVEADFTHNAYLESNDAVTEQPASPEQGESFIEAAAATGALLTPILVAGVAGACMGKKAGPRLLKAVTHYITKRIKATQADPDMRVPDFPDLTYRDAEAKKFDRESQTLPGSYLERVDETQPYVTAKKWATYEGCTDERHYADFLLAYLPPGDVRKMVQRTKKRHKEVVASKGELTPEDPRYANLLHDMLMVEDITQRCAETHTTFRRIGRGLGCLAALGFITYAQRNGESTPDMTPISYGRALFVLSMNSLLLATWGYSLGELSLRGTDYITQRRSRRRIARASDKPDVDTSGP
jgi:hypothetical protein